MTKRIVYGAIVLGTLGALAASATAAVTEVRFVIGHADWNPYYVALSSPTEPPPRPEVGPGGDNWIPHVSRALSTADLTSGLTPADLVAALLGPGVAVSNVTFSGVDSAAGTFAGGTGIIGFESGIILSSGHIAFVPGPNTQDAVTADNGQPGDPDLDALIPGYATHDRCVLEFDFECQGTQVIQFQYVFTSEEYNEWVNSPYNDVFGFFLNGVNIALIPGGGGLPVSINNVNCNNPYGPPSGSFCNLYINNDCSDIPPGSFPCAGNRDTEMDGLTLVFTATGSLNPGVNHIKLAIADAGDHVLDSNVFIKAESFVCELPVGACCDTSTYTCENDVLEADCQGPDDVWSVGLECSALDPPCLPVNLSISIDIWPFNQPGYPNEIYIRKPTRKIPVLVLGSTTFNVSLINFATVHFGPNGTEAAVSGAPQFQDGNYDGIMDVMVKFTTGATGFAVGDTVGRLTGELLSGTDFAGEDSVVIVP